MILLANTQLDNRSTVNVTLQPDTKSLYEVVVVGYGTQSQYNVTGSESVAKVDMKQLESMSSTKVAQTLRGRMAGVRLTSSSPGRDGFQFV